MARKKIAIIGTGISGMACAHFLQRDYDLTLYEKDSHVGGHSHTVSVTEGEREVALDTGFMVYNEVTYPLLTRLFKDLGVETKPTSMSFSVQHCSLNLEFNGSGFNLIFGQRKNLLNPRFWKMLQQISRFNKETLAELEDPQYPELTLAEYVEKRGYGKEFFQWYLSPMAAAVWSSPPDRIVNFPARTLMRFWHNHGFLGMKTHHPWRTVCGGSRQYVEKLTASFSDRIEKGKGVKKVTGRKVLLEDGSEQEFDFVIFASHGDQNFAMLADPSELEQELLSKFHYQKNEALVHCDPCFMPQTKRCWASWNYRVDDERHSTHYWMNNLQGVSDQNDYFVSINPPKPVDEQLVRRRLEYEHPIFDLPAIEAQGRLEELHAAAPETGRYYCGAWQRYGFHEDGIWSADRLCRALLGRDPWA